MGAIVAVFLLIIFLVCPPLGLIMTICVLNGVSGQPAYAGAKRVVPYAPITHNRILGLVLILVLFFIVGAFLGWLTQPPTSPNCSYKTKTSPDLVATLESSPIAKPETIKTGVDVFITKECIMYFYNTPYKLAKFRERYTVAAVNNDTKKVFLYDHDTSGRLIALNVPEDAVIRCP